MFNDNRKMDACYKHNQSKYKSKSSKLKAKYENANVGTRKSNSFTTGSKRTRAMRFYNKKNKFSTPITATAAAAASKRVSSSLDNNTISGSRDYKSTNKTATPKTTGSISLATSSFSSASSTASSATPESANAAGLRTIYSTNIGNSSGKLIQSNSGSSRRNNNENSVSNRNRTPKTFPLEKSKITITYSSSANRVSGKHANKRNDIVKNLVRSIELSSTGSSSYKSNNNDDDDDNNNDNRNLSSDAEQLQALIDALHQQQQTIIGEFREQIDAETRNEAQFNLNLVNSFHDIYEQVANAIAIQVERNKLDDDRHFSNDNSNNVLPSETNHNLSAITLPPGPTPPPPPSNQLPASASSTITPPPPPSKTIYPSP